MQGVMDSASLDHEEEEEAALSDFEEDDLEAAPVVLPAPSSSINSSSSNAAESLKTALADLENERQARKAIEAAKSDTDAANARLKSYVHEVIRQRDEALRQKDEALRQKDEALRQKDEALRGKEERSKQLEEALQLRDDVVRDRDEIVSQRDEAIRQKEEIGRARDSARAEIEGVAFILVTQAEKITSMASSIKSFSGGLPRVPKSTGLSAIALGFVKRVEEVVEEVFRQREEAIKRRDEFHVQVEQRNFSTAIEVSQLEASITQLKDELGKKSLESERWQKLAAGKDSRIAEIENAMLEQLGKTKQEAEILKKRVEEVEGRLQIVNSEIADSAECTAKAKLDLLDILRLMHIGNSPTSLEINSIASQDENEPQHTESLSEGHELIQLARRVVRAWEEHQENLEKERKDWKSTVQKVVEEKSDILQKLSFPNYKKTSSRDLELPLVNDAEDNGVMEVLNSTADNELADDSILSEQNDPDGFAYTPTESYKIIGEVRQQTSLKLLQAELAAHEKRNNQNALKIALLEEDVKNLQQELSTSRLEINRLQQLLADQAKELAGRLARISQMEKHVDSLTRELLAAEEEVARWKDAATAEAAAGSAMLEEVEKRNEEIAALNERLAECRELVEEANSKIGSKEEMALAAIAARNAAERSLQIADERSADLRYRIEEMSRQLEEFEQKGDYLGRGLLDMCWPWLRGRGRPGQNRPGQDVQSSAEMAELLEPLV